MRLPCRLLPLLATLLLISACASNGNGPEPEAGTSNPTGEGGDATLADEAWDEDWDDWDDDPGTADPLERYNRAVFTFNEFFDRTVARPVATGYVQTVPEPGRNRVTNFFANLREPVNVVNHSLQGDAGAATEGTLRFLFNSTFGLLGLFDVAGAMGLERQRTDFGLTLGTWGVDTGPYLVLPFLGPSNVRDASGLGVQFVTREYTGPLHWTDQERDVRWSLAALNVVDIRARLLPATRIMEESGADPYVFMRESYLQQRARRLAGPDDDGWGDEWDDEWDDGDDGWDDEWEEDPD
ncbi:phospholipid-binding lipoprotein MlaA [Alkalispirillum mobile]|uniref:Phospholipid-binding lipoprotein MlaA n=1 Tax=Alkalispirillum mobile TaxID=85925 RepID=A0A498C6U3_9GAMM|nr:VacJ family lipoprotein [Alkalispirillum mobile]RLK51452.1 phospholipid-binding lipoprotein MlaA [Alkalispirillum mobile]